MGKSCPKPHCFIIPFITFAIMMLSSIAISGGMEWYDTLQFPAITPPGWVISLAWTIIYILTTISVIVIWRTFKRDQVFTWIMIFFAINAFLHFLWSVMFFSWHFIGPSIVDMILLEIVTVLLIYLIWPRSRAAGMLLVPYAIWLLFATYLASLIWSLNRASDGVLGYLDNWVTYFSQIF